MKEFNLPDNFLMGTSTASLQIEGGNRNNSWYDWSLKPGKIKDGSNPLRAADHWNRLDEDIELMKKMNNNAYRMSIEWARIEPEEGKYDNEALEHYREEIIKLKENNICPMVTLHHFSNPLWLEKKGGWVNKNSINAFIKYTETVVNYIGEYVTYWCTINEPNIFSLMGYIVGDWPSGEKRGFRAYFRNAENMIKAHIGAYNAIHRIRKEKGFSDTMVGAANHIVIFDSKNNNFFEKLSCRVNDYCFHKIFTIGMCEGRGIFPLTGRRYGEKGKTYADFFGINYYTRNLVSLCFNPLKLFTKVETKNDTPKNDLGWEIYPEGLYRAGMEYYRKYRIPVFITENGTADAKDKVRAKFLYDHLYQISRLIESGVDVRGYYQWTLTDNFEWAEGEAAKFGLVELNYETQERRLRRSAEFYSEICARKAVTKEIIEKYL